MSSKDIAYFQPSTLEEKKKKITGVRMSSSLTSGMSLAQQGMAEAIEAGRELEGG